ncbi:MAG: host-nuclease inhibitor Gam family protein [Geobacteraceae bacterium]|nr:host-nuclease inhibitor Gam family protein [Geobacteraceae bacterium]
MATFAEIEEATTRYADHRELVKLRVQYLNDEIEKLKRVHLPEIKDAAADAANALASLETLIDESRGLFVRPRSIIISGIRVGLQKGKGGLEYDDEDTVIRLIRKVLPLEQHELLIKIKESVNKKALGDLDVATLKKVGVTVQGTGDVVLVKPVDSEVEKIVAAVVKEAKAAAELEEAA